MFNPANQCTNIQQANFTADNIPVNVPFVMTMQDGSTKTWIQSGFRTFNPYDPLTNAVSNDFAQSPKGTIQGICARNI